MKDFILPADAGVEALAAGLPADWAATVWLMHGCGLRIGEALAVRLRCRVNRGKTLRVREQVNVPWPSWILLQSRRRAFPVPAMRDAGNAHESALLLAHDKRLKLSDIMKLPLRQPPLSFLSAETAVIGERLPDEVIGLHTALMQVGVPGVVGLLRAVPNESTALLVARFYDLWRNQGLSLPEALRAAKKWFRDATNAEIESLTGTGPNRQLGYAAYELWAARRATLTRYTGRLSPIRAFSLSHH